MRIGIDFDDTLSDWGVLLSEEARRRWSLDLAAIRAAGQKPDDHVGEQWRKLVLEVLETELTLQLPVKPGAYEVTRRLAERHELVILTARHDHEAKVLAEWVRTNDIPIEQFVTTSREPKHTFATDLGLRIHLDDTARVFDSFVGHPCESALLVGSVFDLHAKPLDHVRSVETWHHFAEVVELLEAGAPPSAVLSPEPPAD